MFWSATVDNEETAVKAEPGEVTKGGWKGDVVKRLYKRDADTECVDWKRGKGGWRGGRPKTQMVPVVKTVANSLDSRKLTLFQVGLVLQPPTRVLDQTLGFGLVLNVGIEGAVADFVGFNLVDALNLVEHCGTNLGDQLVGSRRARGFQ